MSAHKAECEAAGLDCVMVEKYKKKLESLMAAMKKDGLMLFGGGDGSSLRPLSRDPDIALLIVAPIDAANIDGGAGAYGPGPDGLLRGEGG